MKEYPFPIILAKSDSYDAWHSETMMDFSHLSDKNGQSAVPTPCRDFLQDGIHAYLNNMGLVSDGWRVADHPPCIDSAKLMFKLRKSENEGTIEKILDMLHQAEKILGIKPTEIFHATENKYVACGDYRWIYAPPMISFYTLMIRVGSVHVIGRDFIDTFNDIALMDGVRKVNPLYIADVRNARNGLENICNILKVGDQKIFYPKIKDNYSSGISLAYMHSCGIVGFSSNEKAKEHCRGWFNCNSELEAA